MAGIQSDLNNQTIENYIFLLSIHQNIADDKIKRIYDGIEAETRKSQTSFQIIQLSSEALLEISVLRPQHHH